MRLGNRKTIFKGDSLIKKLYGNIDSVDERHRHRYEVNPKYVAALEAEGLKFVGHDVEKERMEIMELVNHPYYVATQYHPEYLSRPLKPSPPFMGFILASVGKLQSYLNQGCRLSPRQMSDESSEEEENFRILNKSFNKNLELPNLTNGFHNGQTNGHGNGKVTNGCSAESSSTDEHEK